MPSSTPTVCLRGRLTRLHAREHAEGSSRGMPTGCGHLDLEAVLPAVASSSSLSACYRLAVCMALLLW